MNFKILRCLVLEFFHSQTWLSMLPAHPAGLQQCPISLLQVRDNNGADAVKLWLKTIIKDETKEHWSFGLLGIC